MRSKVERPRRQTGAVHASRAAGPRIRGVSCVHALLRSAMLALSKTTQRDRSARLSTATPRHAGRADRTRKLPHPSPGAAPPVRADGRSPMQWQAWLRQNRTGTLTRHCNTPFLGAPQPRPRRRPTDRRNRARPPLLAALTAAQGAELCPLSLWNRGENPAMRERRARASALRFSAVRPPSVTRGLLLV